MMNGADGPLIKLDGVRFGKKWSTEVKARISGTQKDRIFTEAHRAALKAAWARRKAATV